MPEMVSVELNGEILRSKFYEKNAWDLNKCNKYTITKDAVISWINEYESYCGYSNSTIGPR